MTIKGITRNAECALVHRSGWVGGGAAQKREGGAKHTGNTARQPRVYEWGILCSQKVVYTLLHNLCLCNT